MAEAILANLQFGRKLSKITSMLKRVRAVQCTCGQMVIGSPFQALVCSVQPGLILAKLGGRNRPDVLTTL